MKTKYIFFFLTISSLCGPVYGQTLPSLTVSADARSLSMGSATVALQAGEYALENNVAAMSLDGRRMSAGVSYMLWQPSLAKSSIAGAGLTYRIGNRWAVAGSFEYWGQQPYRIVTDNGVDSRDGLFTPRELNAALGTSFAITDYLSAGVTVRVTRSVLAPEASANVFGADAGLFFSMKGISAGLVAGNLGTKVRYGESAYGQPVVIKGGAAYSFGFASSSLTVAAQFDVLAFSTCMAGAGLEYSLHDILFVRGGFHYGDRKKTLPTYASVGLGARFWGVSVNAAYLFLSDTLKDTFSVGLGYSF